MQGRWERWQADFDTNPVNERDADKVLRINVENSSLEDVWQQVHDSIK